MEDVVKILFKEEIMEGDQLREILGKEPRHLDEDDTAESVQDSPRDTATDSSSGEPANGSAHHGSNGASPEEGSATSHDTEADTSEPHQPNDRVDS